MDSTFVSISGRSSDLVSDSVFSSSVGLLSVFATDRASRMLIMPFSFNSALDLRLEIIPIHN